MSAVVFAPWSLRPTATERDDFGLCVVQSNFMENTQVLIIGVHVPTLGRLD